MQCWSEHKARWKSHVNCFLFLPSLHAGIQVISSNHHMSSFPLQSTVVEEEEDGMIYTVAVKHHNGALNSPMVNHIWWKGQKCLHCFYDWMSVFAFCFHAVDCVSLPVRESRDRGEAGSPSPPLICHGGLLLYQHFPVHLSVLHLHKESAGYP